MRLLALKLVSLYQIAIKSLHALRTMPVYLITAHLNTTATAIKFIMILILPQKNACAAFLMMA